MSESSRRFWNRRVVVAGVAALLLAPACGLFESGGGSSEEPGTVVVMLPSDNPGDIQARQALAEAFMKQHEDIPVKIQVIPAEGYDQKVFTSIAAGEPPDIFGSGDVIIPTIVSKNYALDLNTLIEKEDYDLSSFYPQVLDGLRFDGKLVGLTDNWDTQVMYYNRELFDKAGLDYPDGTWTWDDFVSNAKQLTEGEGPEKVFGAVHGTWFVPIFDAVWSFGGEVFSEDGSECLLDSKESVAGVQAVADLIEEGLSPTPEQLEGQSPTQLLLSGRAAMVIDAGRWGAFELQEGRVDWAVAPLPKGPAGRQNFFHLGMFAIARNSDSKENAWEFLKYMVSKEGIQSTVDNLQGIPARKPVAKSSVITDSAIVQEHDALDPFLESLPTAHTAPYVEDFAVYIDTIGAGMDPIWSGEKSAAEVLPSVCDKVEEQIAEQQAQ
ncbi:MAG: extracellular solute-binding protein [Actinobacteria bacterium]|nr:extracellular solute-binding protein [Actinomycetota bacterium]